MENYDFKEERFDSFLNKTIIMSSRVYFKKQMNTLNKEKVIMDDEEYSTFLQGFLDTNNLGFLSDTIENNIELENALKNLSAIEQAVIFLLFQEELTQDEAAKILEVYSKTVSKIKIRAINKLRKYLKGDLEDGK